MSAQEITAPTTPVLATDAATVSAVAVKEASAIWALLWAVAVAPASEIVNSRLPTTTSRRTAGT